jgi:hypothetical protein
MSKINNQTRHGHVGFELTIPRGITVNVWGGEK